MLTLTVPQRLELKARAHALNPLVIIGNAGLTPAVLNEIDQALKHHELIKVKAAGSDREQRETLLSDICEQLAAAPVQHIGKTLVIFRPEPDKSTPIRKVPKTRNKKKAATKKQLGARS